MQPFLLAVIGALLALGVGCAPAARQISEAATPTALHSGLHEVNTPDDQQQLQQLADSPALRHAAQAAGAGVVRGIYDESNRLAGGDIPADAGARDSLPATTNPGASTQSASQPGSRPDAAHLSALSGGMNGLVKSSVREAFLTVSDPQFKASEEAMSEAIGEGFVSGVIKVLNEKGPQIGDTIRRQLGPIVQELIREQIAPAVRDMLQQQLAPVALGVWKEGATETLKLTVRPDLQPDVQQNAQNISIGAGHGTNQMLIDSGWLAPSGDLSPKIKRIAWVGAGGLMLFLLAVFSLLVMLNLLVLHHWRKRNRDRHSGG